MKEVFEEHSVTVIDYCNIDVEGGEMNVLESIDFSKIKIRVFTIENNYGTNVVRNFLKPLGYKLIGKLGADEVFALNSKRFDLIVKLKIKQVKNYISKVFKNKIKLINNLATFQMILKMCYQ